MPAAHGFTNDGILHEVIEPLWIQGLGTVRQGFSGIGVNLNHGVCPCRDRCRHSRHILGFTGAGWGQS